MFFDLINDLIKDEKIENEKFNYIDDHISDETSKITNITKQIS
jgi:hypothetical protein